MRIKTARIAGVIFLMFVLYSVSPNFFERQLYFNEILSLTGLLVLIGNSCRNGRLYIANSAIYKLVVVLLGLGLLHMLVSLYFKTNLYFYLRNSVIVYSIFPFFIGFYWLVHFTAFIASVRGYFRVLLGSAVLSGVKTLLDRFVAAAFFPFFFRRYTRLTIFSLSALNVIYAITFESMTVTLVTIILLGIVVVRHYILFQLGALLAVAGFIALTIYLKPSIELYKTGPYRLFGNVEAVTQDHFLLRADGNSTWRLVFWYRIVTENFPQNLVGIGLGTPLLPYREGMDTALTNLDNNTAEYDDEHDIHVMGAHNTYITVALRLGIGFIVILLLIFGNVFREYYRWFNYYRQNGQVLLFLSFFTISIIGLFNLVLESPISAAAFWLLLGLVSRAIHNRKFSYQRLAAGQPPHPIENV